MILSINYRPTIPLSYGVPQYCRLLQIMFLHQLLFLQIFAIHTIVLLVISALFSSFLAYLDLVSRTF